MAVIAMVLVLAISIVTCILTNDFYNNIRSKPLDCQDLQKYGNSESGVYTIYPKGILGFHVRYDFNDSTSGAWTVIQRRVSSSDFYKDWNGYQVGFGDLHENIWLGNQQNHMITRQGWYELRIDLVSSENELTFASYNVLYVGGVKSRYELSVDGYSGTVGNSMAGHNGHKFSTKDRDNDINDGNCAVDFKAACRYEKCHYSNLNGLYGNNKYVKGFCIFAKVIMCS